MTDLSCGHLEVLPHQLRPDEKGIPILFVHGAWHGAWCWEPMLPFFRNRGYAAYALSLRGHGLSQGHHKLRFTSLRDYVDDIHRVARLFKQPPVLVGHSMGGHLVRMYMSRHDVAGAVLMAPATPRGVWDVTWSLARKHFWRWMKAHLTLSLYPFVDRPLRARELLFGEMDMETVQEYWSQLGDESYRAFLELLKPNMPKPLNEKTPCLILGGDEDALFSRDHFEALATEINAELRLLQGFAHDLMVQPGWEQATRSMIDWFWENGLGIERRAPQVRPAALAAKVPEEFGTPLSEAL